jgi:hypothetical protein
LKKTAFVLVISASTMLMVLPLLRGVNHPGNNEVRIEKTLRADGNGTTAIGTAIVCCLRFF